MSINGQTYCDACLLHIGIQKHTTFRKPGTKGESLGDYLHFHNRGVDDCWNKRQREGLPVLEFRENPVFARAQRETPLRRAA